MEYQVLARKWRPTNFTDLIGQEQISRTLQNAIELERVAHAYLFTGVRGVGKTSSARILAKALNCEKGPTAHPCNECNNCREITAGNSMDVLEIDGASNTGVDDVRELKENIQYLPTHGHYKIYIIDEVHMLSKAAFNALLKTLEEPPKSVVFILATTEPQKLPETILSRCQRFDFKRVSAETLASHLSKIMQSEAVEISPSLLKAVAQEAQGSVRDALTLLDRLISYCGKKVEESRAREILGLVDRTVLLRLLGHATKGEANAALQTLQQIYIGGHDLKRLVEALMQQIRHALLLKVGLPMDQIGLSSDEAKELREIFFASGQNFSEIELERYFELTKQAYLDLNRVDQELFVVEMLLMKMSHVKSDYINVLDVLQYLKGTASTTVSNKPSVAAPSREYAAPPSQDTIEDPYVKQTVNMFGAKVEKIHIKED
jgi:DNA polymerase-3 subunit gamma/tau